MPIDKTPYAGEVMHESATPKFPTVQPIEQETPSLRPDTEMNKRPTEAEIMANDLENSGPTPQ